jgi:hypothetical protein
MQGESVRKESFDGHSVWSNLTSLQSALDAADERGKEADAAEPLDAIRYLVSLIRSHQEPNDTAPYSVAGLNQVSQSLPNVTTEVNNYASNGNLGHLQNAETHADQIVHVIGSWPTTLLKGGAAAQANKVFVAYRNDATAAIKALRKENEKLLVELEAARSEADSALQTLKGEVQAQGARISQDETRLDTALTNMNDAFTTKQSEREEKFQAFIEKQANAVRILAADDLGAIRAHLDEAHRMHEEINDLREGTEKVAGLASADILAGKFQAYSAQQWKWGVGANILGFVALASGLAVIAWTLHSVGANEEISWQYTTLKLGVTLTIIAASAVAFRLGALFLSRSGTSKRMELELRAIGPFFADIEDLDAVKEAKRAFVERSFGRGWGDQGNGSSPPEVDNGVLARELLEIIKTVTTSRSAVP